MKYLTSIIKNTDFEKYMLILNIKNNYNLATTWEMISLVLILLDKLIDTENGGVLELCADYKFISFGSLKNTTLL